MPEVAAALHVDGSTALAGSAETPFRIASVTKSFTATLVAEAGLLDERRRALSAHTADLRPESADPLPEICRGLWSYSNAGYREAVAAFDDWSTVGDLVTYGLAHCERWPELHEPVAPALGARYASGWWNRDGVLDHEGSVGGYQSLLLVAPVERLVLAVLTSSWRGSSLIRHVVEDVGIVPPSTGTDQAVEGRYAMDTFDVTVADGRIVELETDPVTGTRIERRGRFSGDATLMSWRSDFPREGVGRIWWTALPRIA